MLVAGNHEIPSVAGRDLGVEVRRDLEAFDALRLVAFAENDVGALDNPEAVVQRADLLVDFPEETAFVHWTVQPT